MKKNSTNYFKQLMALLESLHKSYPNEGIGHHISLALSDYPDLFVVSDRELLFAFTQYQSERELDINNLASDEYVKKIAEDAEHLFDKQPDNWEDEFEEY